MLRWHAHGWVDRWRRRRPVWGTCWTRVVLTSSPAETHTRVANGVALHLVDGHLSGVTLNELNESAALSGRNLDVRDLAKALEERPELILSNVAREATNKDSGIVRVGKLVHGLLLLLLGSVRRHTVRVHSVHASHRLLHTHGRTSTLVLVFGSCGRDPHRTVAAVDTLHFLERTLLVSFISEADEAVTTRETSDWVGHDLGGLARWESVLEDVDENIFIDLWAKVANKDAVFWAAVIPRIC